MDPWYADKLACPRDRLPLELVGDSLECARSHSYPVVDGVPVLLRDDVEQTQHIAQRSLRSARREEGFVDRRAPDLYLETFGFDDDVRNRVAKLAMSQPAIDPVVSYVIGATCGFAYEGARGNLTHYPIPDIRIPAAPCGGGLFLDLGCNWGRWCIAAARKGYHTVGIDPCLGAVMAARRVARHFGFDNRYLVADARYLPFRDELFDRVFSYSVLQHLSKDNVRAVLAEVGRVLKPGGVSTIQMANSLGVRSLYHQARTGFREPSGFAVRYWRPGELVRAFSEAVGDTSVSVDCYFGLGLQKADLGLMSGKAKAATLCSEALRGLARRVTPLRNVADSLYVQSIK